MRKFLVLIIASIFLIFIFLNIKKNKTFFERELSVPSELNEIPFSQGFEGVQEQKNAASGELRPGRIYSYVPLPGSNGVFRPELAVVSASHSKDRLVSLAQNPEKSENTAHEIRSVTSVSELVSGSIGVTNAREVLESLFQGYVGSTVLSGVDYLTEIDLRPIANEPDGRMEFSFALYHQDGRLYFRLKGRQDPDEIRFRNGNRPELIFSDEGENGARHYYQLIYMPDSGLLKGNVYQEAVDHKLLFTGSSTLRMRGK